MNDFLYYLAKNKYDHYDWLYKRFTYATTEREITDRLRKIHEYSILLEVISMLPVEVQVALAKIEQDYFYDAPYVLKKHEQL